MFTTFTNAVGATEFDQQKVITVSCISFHKLHRLDLRIDSPAASGGQSPIAAPTRDLAQAAGTAAVSQPHLRKPLLDPASGPRSGATVRTAGPVLVNS